MPKASVIVPARDAERTILRTLSALAGQRLAGGAEIIVVDNGSADDTARLVEHAGLADRLIRRRRGEGPGAARNAGAAAAQGEVLAFIDSDCWPAAGWLAAGVAAVGAADLVQGRVLPDPAAAAGPFDRTLAVTEAHGLFETANLFVSRELFGRLGGFPPGLEQGGAPFGEDVVFGWSACRSGARMAFCAEALAYHAVLPRGARDFVAERNRLRLFPELASRVPELREEFFYRRWFHSRRSAAFDLALSGCAAALWRRQALPLAAVLPYMRELYDGARPWGMRRAPAVALASVAADAVGAVALVRGSVATGSPLL